MFDHPCRFPKPVRAEPVEACAGLCFGGSSNKPRVARRQLTFFLRRQKESKQRKRRPDGLGPFASLRATCGARRKRGRARTRCAQTIARPDPFSAALLGPARRVAEKAKYQRQKSGVLEARSAS